MKLKILSSFKEKMLQSSEQKLQNTPFIFILIIASLTYLISKGMDLGYSLEVDERKCKISNSKEQ